MRSIGILIFLCILIACGTAQQPAHVQHDSIKQADVSAVDSFAPRTEIREIFTDSLQIGDQGRCKVELIKHRVLEETYVIIKFYTKGPASWYIQNTYLYECNTSMDLGPELLDFNNDGFKDITFISASAARGSNEVRRLLVYDDRERQLISIVNAEQYPNIRYNKTLDCIDAFMLHGGSSTVFARIRGDSLKTFAAVHNDSHRTVYEVDASGRQHLLRKDSITDPDEIFTRYEQYKPLKAYEK